MLFGQNNNNNDNESSNYNKTNYYSMLQLVGDKSIFGRYYVKICDILKNRKVPVSRMPSKEHFLSRVFSCIDEEKFSNWIQKYAEIESANIENESDEESQ